MGQKILVTGATGNVGHQVGKALLESGQAVVAPAKDERDARRVPEGAEPRFFRFGRPETYPAAFEGVNKLFLMRPPQISDVKRYLFPVIDYAKGAGVTHIVFLSLIGVERNKRVPHYKVEQYLARCGVPYTLVRPSFYMQNLSTTHRQEIVEEDKIAVPVGKARTSFIDVRDAGAVAAKVLSEPGHENRFYELTGGEALDYYQVADLFTEILGRKITYTDPSLLRFVYETVARGGKLPFALVMAFLYAQTKRGMADRVTDEVARLLGRPPITMRQYIQDYAQVWRVDKC
jgi:uncharacterized protein YbjT (DUF2867 family)